MNDTNTQGKARPNDGARFCVVVAALLGACAPLGGCLQSARHDFLALRANAPLPERGARTTLADALPSNVGPTVPPTALAEVFDR